MFVNSIRTAITNYAMFVENLQTALAWEETLNNSMSETYIHGLKQHMFENINAAFLDNYVDYLNNPKREAKTFQFYGLNL